MPLRVCNGGARHRAIPLSQPLPLCCTRTMIISLYKRQMLTNNSYSNPELKYLCIIPLDPSDCCRSDTNRQNKQTSKMHSQSAHCWAALLTIVFIFPITSQWANADSKTNHLYLHTASNSTPSGDRDTRKKGPLAGYM